jgi:hypothetical protein
MRNKYQYRIGSPRRSVSAPFFNALPADDVNYYWPLFVSYPTILWFFGIPIATQEIAAACMLHLKLEYGRKQPGRITGPLVRFSPYLGSP